jgi:hypothetical protein
MSANVPGDKLRNSKPTSQSGCKNRVETWEYGYGRKPTKQPWTKPSYFIIIIPITVTPTGGVTVYLP